MASGDNLFVVEINDYFFELVLPSDFSRCFKTVFKSSKYDKEFILYGKVEKDFLVLCGRGSDYKINMMIKNVEGHCMITSISFDFFEMQNHDVWNGNNYELKLLKDCTFFKN